ncbi:ACP S-malonyltransferase [Kitasatospora sp. LaBMicrA B282]|uniref:ACP S-malonyltransferase n=1 Tax=Kitasatospora sp. LaBMicrA B282 TaxID=3420949 RepID=UPI003D13CFF4
MSTRPKVFGFPGQGAQAAGMGAELFDRFPALTAEADALLGYSIAALCRDNPDGALLRTEYAQPALYTVEALALLAHREQDPVPADYLAGHSLGEYTALFAAGVFDFGTGLRLVQRRGELMGRAGGGSMAAVLGLELPAVRELLDRFGLTELDVALHNAPGQIALAGPVAEIDRLVEAAAEAEVRCIRLNVSGPFHSRHMRAAAEEFADFLAGFELAEPRVPVLANATARPHRAGEVADALVRQITQPVLWEQSVRHLIELAAPADGFDFVELGPGRTLTGMVDRIRRAAVPARAA